MFRCSNVQIFQCKNVQMFQYSNVPMFKFWNVQMFEWSNAQMFQCSNVQMFKCSNVQMFKCSNFQMFKCSNLQMSKVKCQMSIRLNFCRSVLPVIFSRRRSIFSKCSTCFMRDICVSYKHIKCFSWAICQGFSSHHASLVM